MQCFALSSDLPYPRNEEGFLSQKESKKGQLGDLASELM